MLDQQIKSRDEIQISDTWKLEDIFASDKDVQTAFNTAQQLLKKFKDYKGRVISSSDTLLSILQLRDRLNEIVSKLYLYCNMRLHQDANNSLYQDLASKSGLLLNKVNTQLAFITTEISTLDVDKLEAFVYSTPNLNNYHRFISEILRQKAHILDARTEELLSNFQEVADAPANIFAMFNNADLTFQPVTTIEGSTIQITHGNYAKLLTNTNQAFRKKVFYSYYKGYQAFDNTLAQMFAANVTQLSLFANIRGYATPLISQLDTNNIPIHVYTNLIDTINQNLPIFYDYIQLRKDHLKVDELHMYDLFVPLVHEASQSISYDEACDIVLKALEPLGYDYVQIIKEAFENRWVDKYENKGKRSGAYSWGTFGTPHPYVLLNYNDTLNNLFTLAHEMGHALHSYLSNKHQPAIYSHYCIFVAEVASTVNESLLIQYLLKTTTDPLKRKYLINHFMEQFRNTIYRQTMFAEFEKFIYELHQQGHTLTTELICKTYYDLVKKYHGPHIVVDELIKIEWARIPHFYTPFYVYQYATGFSAAIALSKRILEEGETAVADYLNFLSSGSSKDPITLLQDAGVDMTTSVPIESALSLFKDLIQEFTSI